MPKHEWKGAARRNDYAVIWAPNFRRFVRMWVLTSGHRTHVETIITTTTRTRRPRT